MVIPADVPRSKEGPFKKEDLVLLIGEDPCLSFSVDEPDLELMVEIVREIAGAQRRNDEAAS